MIKVRQEVEQELRKLVEVGLIEEGKLKINKPFQKMVTRMKTCKEGVKRNQDLLIELKKQSAKKFLEQKGAYAGYHPYYKSSRHGYVRTNIKPEIMSKIKENFNTSYFEDFHYTKVLNLLIEEDIGRTKVSRIKHEICKFSDEYDTLKKKVQEIEFDARQAQDRVDAYNRALSMSDSYLKKWKGRQTEIEKMENPKVMKTLWQEVTK